MREFMVYVQNAFYNATGWSQDNSYSTLNSTAHELLCFSTPQGLRLNLSSLATPHFATSYQLGSVGIVDGSVSYLYSSVPLKDHFEPQSETLSLPVLCRGYRPLRQLHRRDPVKALQLTVEEGPSLLYGRLYLPQSLLEALVVKRFSSGLQLQLRAVSSKTLKNRGSLLGLAQYDVGKYAVEGLASSDGGLLGLRGVYNFGGDAKEPQGSNGGASEAPIPTNGNGTDRERIYGRFTAGGEIYYGTLNKSGGVSCGLRFATLPSYRGTPLTATVTLNPLMGSIRASYSVVAGRHCSLATMLDFNVYSYESNWSVGMELWRKDFLRSVEAAEASPQQPGPSISGLVNMDPAVAKAWSRSLQAKLEWRLDEPAAKATETVEKTEPAKKAEEEEYSGVIKARISQNSRIGILWEGRVKALLYSIGSGIDLHRPDQPFRTLGLEIQYSS
ncbi:hypothetical protein jhhlp_000020 [Lomentospora prolificans]|uniref:Mitochondrial distribution and morphology protein 10 n=1 Tax=Lomentospora prolificans TaxID=41688 RepID=A0A2N3NLF7_9PEZI|nr:hypothetical protein jhhlp_000020 [Lomentospora prolificans]